MKGPGTEKVGLLWRSNGGGGSYCPKVGGGQENVKSYIVVCGGGVRNRENWPGEGRIAQNIPHR